MFKNYFHVVERLQTDELSDALAEFSLTAIAFGRFELPADKPKASNILMPYHRLIYMLQGEAQYQVGEQEVYLKKGDALYTPAGSVYCAQNMNLQTPMQFLYLYFSVEPAHRVYEFIDLLQGPNGVCKIAAHPGKVEFYFSAMEEENSIKMPGYFLKIQSFLQPMAIELMRSRHLESLAVKARNRQPSSDILNHATAYIGGHLTMPLRVETISRVCGVSKNHLYKIFMQFLGIGPSEYIQQTKIEFACRLLEREELTVNQIARELAFSSANYFSNAFLKIKGVRPTQYRMGRRAE